MKKILFVCVHNAGRSQMAEAFFNHLAKGKALAISTGTKPASGVNTDVVQVMLEAGIDIRNRKPKLLTFDMLENSDRVITMGCGVETTCPATLVPSEDWGLQDPEGKPIQKIQEVRDKVEVLIQDIILGKIKGEEIDKEIN